MTAFEIWQSEAYRFDDIIEGGSYTFSHCNGASGTWVPEYTVIAPSGAIDNFGEGDGDGCSITWTASESGQYLVVINEAEECGVAGNDDNGFPMITTNSGGAECPEPVAPPVVLEGAVTFEGGVLPDCWETVDADGDGNDWNFAEGLPGFEGDWAIRSQSWMPPNEPLTPDNYLITPPLSLEEGDSLYYVVRAVDPNFAAENYSVLVSATGNDIADFTDVVFTETLETGDWLGRSVDLSAYNGQIIYIAFRHHDVTDEFAMQLDAIALPGEVLDCEAVSTEDYNVSSAFNVFPNPTDGIVNLVNSGETDMYQIRVFDINGRLIAQEQVRMNTGANHEINLAGNAPGMYTVQFVSGQKTGVQKLIIR